MKEYVIYDMKNYEMLVYMGTIKEIADFLGLSKNTLYSHIYKKKKGKDGTWKLVSHQYELVEVKEDTDDEIFQELLKACETPKPKFEIYKPKPPIKIEQDEEWKVIEGFHYSISNYGRIRNDKTKLIKEARFRRWELKTDIYQDGKRYTVNIKRITAEYFIV